MELQRIKRGTVNEKLKSTIRVEKYCHCCRSLTYVNANNALNNWDSDWCVTVTKQGHYGHYQIVTSPTFLPEFRHVPVPNFYQTSYLVKSSHVSFTMTKIPLKIKRQNQKSLPIFWIFFTFHLYLETFFPILKWFRQKICKQKKERTY